MSDIIFGDRELIDPRVYTGTQAFTVQSFTEANVKNGVQYYLAEVFELSNSEVKYFTFTTGNKDTIVKFRQISVNGGLEYKVFRNPIVASDGVNVAVNNFNDYYFENNEIIIQEDPTVTSEGEQWDVLEAFAGHGQQQGGGVFGTSGAERILKANTTYLVKFDNTENSTIRVQYLVSWYEGPLSIDIL